MGQINAAGGVLGRPLELVTEDDQGTNPGAIAAFNRLASRGDITAYMSPSRSTQVFAIDADVRRVGKIMMMSCQDPKLTHMGNSWLLRENVTTDGFATATINAGTKTLGKSKWAVVFTTDAFGQSYRDSLVAAIAAQGLKPVLVQGFVPQASDLTPVVLAVKQSGVDIVTIANSLGNRFCLFIRQLKELGATATFIGARLPKARLR